MADTKRTKVFISYSRKDERHLQKLQARLKPIEREGTIELWHDQQITAGTDWAREIDSHLDSADIILLLVSPAFLASSYCHERELAIALFRHKRRETQVIPIIVKPVDFGRTPLANLQALPKNLKPVSAWRDPDEAWLDVEKGIRRVIDELATRRRLAENVATSARRVALRIAMLRGRRTQLGLLVAREAARRDPTPELWSELASSIAACAVRPLPGALPDGIKQWMPNSDFRRALLWLNDGRGWIVDLGTGEALAELKQVDHLTGMMHGGDTGEFSPDGRLIAAVGRTRKRPKGKTEKHNEILSWHAHGELGIWDAATGKLLACASDVTGTATFSADGQQVLVGSHAGGAVISGVDGLALQALADRPLSVHDRRGAPSPDGKTVLAVHTEDRNAYLIANGETRKLIGHEHRIIHGAWSPDGNRILTCARDGTGRIWGSDGQLQATFRAHNEALTWGDWHPDGKSVATVALDGSAWIWDFEGQPLRSLPPARPGTYFCQWSPTGERLLIWSLGAGPLRVFDRKGRELPELLDDLEHIKMARWHPDGVTIYGLGAGGRLGRWSSQPEPLCALAPEGRVVAAGFAPDSTAVLTVDTAAAEATLWDLRGEKLLSVSVPGASLINTVALRPDGEAFLTVSQSEGVRTWDRHGKQIGALQGHPVHQGEIWRAVWSASGDRILTVSNDGAARVWNSDGSPVAVLGDHFYGVMYGAFSPDGSRVLTMCGHGHARVWSAAGPFIPVPKIDEAQAPEQVDAETPHEAPCQRPNFRFGPYDQYGQLLVQDVCVDPPVELAAPLLVLWSQIGSNDHVGRWPTFSPDGRLVLFPNGCALAVPNKVDKSTGATSPAEVSFDPLGRVNPERFALRLVGPDGAFAHDASFNGDGSRIATAHVDAARIWDSSGRLQRELKGHVNSVWMVRFSPDGQQLLTVVDEGRVLQLWEVATGRWLATLPGPPDSILHVTFSPDGRHILAHAAKIEPGLGIITTGYVWIWPADLPGLLSLAERRAGRALTDDECQLYLD